MYWVYHHHAYTFIDGVDGVLLWLNIVFLLLISFMPFPTMMLGRYPGQTLPVVFYGCNLLLANLHGLAMLLYLKHAPQLASRRLTPVLFRRQITVYIVVNSLYLANIGLAFVLPRVALTIFAAMAVYLMVRSAMVMGIGTCVPIEPLVPAGESSVAPPRSAPHAIVSE